MNRAGQDSPSIFRRAAVVAISQVLIVSALGAKLLYDRAALPRGWVATVALDPDLPIRGRYVRLNAVFDLALMPDPGSQDRDATRLASVELSVNPDNGMLRAVPTSDPPDAAMLRLIETPAGETVWTLAEPVVFFLPEHAADPSRLQADEALWVEATVTRSNQLRPIRLGLYRAGVLTPLPAD